MVALINELINLNEYHILDSPVININLPFNLITSSIEDIDNVLYELDREPSDIENSFNTKLQLYSQINNTSSNNINVFAQLSEMIDINHDELFTKILSNMSTNVPINDMLLETELGFNLNDFTNMILKYKTMVKCYFEQLFLLENKLVPHCNIPSYMFQFVPSVTFLYIEMLSS